MTKQTRNAELEHRNRFFKNTSWMLVAKISRAAEVVVRSIVIARSLGIELYAVYAIITAFTGPFMQFFNANLGSLLIKFGSEYREEGSREKVLALVKLSYLVTLAMYVAYVITVCLAVTLFYSFLISEPGLHLYLLLFAAAAGGTFFDLLAKSLLVLHDRFSVNTFVDIVCSILNVLLVATVAFWFKGNLAAIILVVAGTMISSTIIVSAAAFFELRNDLSGWYRVSIKKVSERYRELFRFAFGNSLSRSVESLTKGVDVVILALVATPAAVSIYDVCRKLASVFFMLKDPVTAAAFPQIAAMMAKKQFSDFSRLLASVYKVLWAPVLGCLLCVCFLDKLILGIWGEQFAQPGWVLFWTTLRTLVPLVFFWTVPTALSLGKVKLRFYSTLIGTSIGLLLAFPLGLLWQASGVAVAMLVSACVAELIRCSRLLLEIRSTEKVLTVA